MTFEQIKELIVLIVGPAAVLAGVWLTYVLTTRNERKNFSAREIMQKKIESYDELFRLYRKVESKIQELFDNADNDVERERLVQECYEAGVRVLQYCDDNVIYLDENVTLHISASLLVSADVRDMDPNAKTYKQSLKDLHGNFRYEYATSIALIQDYIGIKRLEKSFKKINKPTTTSPVIEFAKNYKKKRK